MRRMATTALAVLSLAGIAIAGTPQAPLQLGRIWVNPEFDGTDGWAGSCLQYPAGIPRVDDNPPTLPFNWRWVGHGKKRGTYLFSTDWTDPDGTAWEHALSYAFRSYNYDYPTSYVTPDLETASYTAMSYVYPVGIQERFRWPRPIVTLQSQSPITGADTLITIQFHPGSAGWDSITSNLPDFRGDGPRPEPVIDPSLVTEEVIDATWRYIQGVELTRSTYGYPFGSPHQDYVIEDISLTNNGISGSVSGAPILNDQTITNMVWANAYHYSNAQAAMHQRDEDIDAMYIEPWSSGVHTAVLFSDMDSEDTEIVDWGDPAEADSYWSHMLGNAYVLIGPLFVSAGSGADITVDDPAQPAFRMIYYERGLDIAGKPYSPPAISGTEGAVDNRELLTYGTYQLPLNTSFHDFPTLASPAILDKPVTSIMGYGPLTGEISGSTSDDHGWDIPFGESVRIVQILAAGGIDQEEARRISIAWKAAAGNTGVSMGYAKRAMDPMDESSITDVELVKTGRDTVLKAAAMAYWNFNGTLPANVDSAKLASWGVADLVNPKPAMYGEFDVPDAPRPPAAIYVRLIESTGIEVRWTKEAEESLDHDTGVQDMAGYRVWRQAGSRSAPWELLAEGPSQFYLDAAHDPLPAEKYFLDSGVMMGKEYWYAVTTYDDGSQNWARSGKPLESSRWWTWTGFSPIGTVAPSFPSVKLKIASRLEANTPNPFNPVTTIRFTLAQATPVKLVVYNMAGQRVRTLIDGARYAGSHNIVWDGKDAMGRNCASGVYVSRLITPKMTDVRKLTLVR